MRDFLTRHYGNNFDAFFGKGTGKAMLHATAGRYPPNLQIPLPEITPPFPSTVPYSICLHSLHSSRFLGLLFYVLLRLTHDDINDSLIGIGEIFLLPLDVLKIKRQTNPEAFRGRGLFKIVRDEGFALYRGWEWTAARNAPGSFAV